MERTAEQDATIRLDPVERAVAELAAGRPVVVADDADRENEGDLIFAAELATPELLAFMVRYTSGYVCVALTEHDADRLHLPPMVQVNQDRHGTAYAVTVDARGTGTGTGISATDRAVTVGLLAAAGTTPEDLTRPGHVVPLRARAGGVLRRPGHTEAAIDLCTLAGLRPAGALCEIVSERDPSGMARLPELREFADEHGLALITIADLAVYLRSRQQLVERGAEARLPLEQGQFRAIGYRDSIDGREHVALVLGDLGEPGVEHTDVLVRLHSECLTGDGFGSLRCDCGPQLQASLAAVAAEGRGVVVYLRGHEGRGIGLLSKLQAYQLQDGGADTVDANLLLGLPVDARDYGIGAAVLRDLGIRSVRLLSNNPAKRDGLAAHGITVLAQLGLHVTETKENRPYLQAKQHRLGHHRPPTARHDLTGVVVHGDARGRTLGYPTANLEVDEGVVVPDDGVYAGTVYVHRDGARTLLGGAAVSIGTNPTFAGQERRVEAYLLDFDGDLYGQRLEVELVAFIRPTLTFDSVSALVRQIEGDVAEIGRLLEPVRAGAQ